VQRVLLALVMQDAWLSFPLQNSGTLIPLAALLAGVPGPRPLPELPHALRLKHSRVVCSLPSSMCHSISIMGSIACSHKKRKGKEA